MTSDRKSEPGKSDDRKSKTTVMDVLDEVAARQRELGIVIDEDEVAHEADKAVAEVREEERKKRNPK